MPLDDLLISTGVDNLIKLVHERGRVEMKAAAAELRVPLQTVEDWAHVLESEGIIKIQYQLTSVYLAWASMSPEEYTKAAKTVQVKKSETVSKLESLGSTVEKSVSELDELRGQFGDLQKKTHTELDALGTDRAEADRLAMQAQEVISAKTARLEQLKTELERFHGELEGFSALLQKPLPGATGGAKPGTAGAMDVGAQMDALGATAARLEEKIRTTDAQFAGLETEIKQLQGQLGSDTSLSELSDIRTAVEDLKFARVEMSKNAEALRNDMKSLGTEIATLTSRLSEVEAKKTATVNPKKALSTLEALSKQTARERESTLSELTRNLEAVRKQIQAYSQAQYQHQTIKTQLESLQAQYAKESEELEQFLGLLDGASKRYAKDLATAKGSLASGQKEYEAMLLKAQKVQGVLTQIESLRGEGEQLSQKLRGVIKEAQVVALSAPVGDGRGASLGAMGAGGAMTAGMVSPGAGLSSGTAGAPGGGGIDNLPPELVQRIALTTMEEQEFERKREDLRGLIKKMWEDDRKPPNA